MPTRADHLVEVHSARLSGRTYLLRGASGAVGTAVCRVLREAGAKIAVAAHKPHSVKLLQDRLDGSDHLVGLVPTGDGEAARGFVKGVEDSLGPVDALLSTAGAFAAARIEDTRAGDELAMLRANFLSVHDVVRAVVGPMVRRNSGSVVLTGARVAGAEIPKIALYSAAKSALHAYAAGLRAEVRERGISVTVVAPGVIDTEPNRRAMPDADRTDWIPVDRVALELLAASLRQPGDQLLVEV